MSSAKSFADPFDRLDRGINPIRLNVGDYFDVVGDAPDETSAIDAPVFDPGDPMTIARYIVTKRHLSDGSWTLRNDGASVMKWDSVRYAELPDAALRADIYADLEPAKRCIKVGKEQTLGPFAPTKAKVDNVVDAIQSLVYTPRAQPAWLTDDQGLPDPQRVIACPNGLIHLRPDATAELFSPPTPTFFSRNAIDYPFEASASPPAAWLAFLAQTWPDDPQAIRCLQMWFGYCLTADTSLQKALMMVGPKRAGKGLVARVLTRVIGAANVCGPTLAGMATNFGLWPLLGKLLAIVSDARLSARTDQAIITERLLALTGEDAITVDRKNREPVTVRIPARLMILTNELPKLADASGALASRFIVLIFKQSHYGQEDIGLEDRICAELPGILNWAIEGWQMLQQSGRFDQPVSSVDAIEELNDLASPAAAFVREWCIVKPGLSVSVADIFEAWQLWCHEQGNTQPGTQAVFGRDLRASVGGLGMTRANADGVRERRYSGIDLTLVGKESVRVARAQHADRGER